MQTTNILWTGREYYSLENCLIAPMNTGFRITSCIVGMYGEILYRVNYTIVTNAMWETTLVEIESRHHSTSQSIRLEGDGTGKWWDKEGERRDLDGCLYVDIPLTPFTNTLPINRLKLAVGEHQTITVLYIDLLERRIAPVQQKYTRLSPSEYHYENVPNDFEATIQVDEQGLVVEYPMLFTRTAAVVHPLPS